MKIATILLVALVLAGCTNETDARRALDGAGYSNIALQGYAWFACDGKSDTFATKFSANGPTGKPVSGAVCSGFLKGSTIRTD